MDIEFIGKAALQKIYASGIKRKQVGLVIDGPPLTGPNTTFWKISKNGKAIGKVTSAIYSPRLKKNIALAMVTIDNSENDTELMIQMNTNFVKATVVDKPFYDPKKKIVAN